VLFGLESSDAHSGLRAFRSEALEQLSLRCGGMELASEIVVKAARAGLKVAEVPIVYHPRTGDSKLNSLRDAWRHMRFLLVLSALRVFLWPGLVLFGAGAAGQAVLLGLGRSELGLRLTTIALCVTLLGMQLLVLGLFSVAYAQYAGLEESQMSRLVDRSFNLERGLLASALVGLLGGIVLTGPLLGAVPGRWLALELETFGSGVIFLGAQLALCSFLLASFPAPFERASAPQAIVLP
jgi:hypothetical protein